MSGNLWTPGGMVKINKGRIDVTSREMKILADFAEVAQKYDFHVVCPKCDSTLHGSNTGDGRTGVYSVACRCREFICDLSAEVGRSAL